MVWFREELGQGGQRSPENRSVANLYSDDDLDFRQEQFKSGPGVVSQRSFFAWCAVKCFALLESCSTLPSV